MDETGRTQIQNCLLSSRNPCHKMLLILDVLHRFEGRLDKFVEEKSIYPLLLNITVIYCSGRVSELRVIGDCMCVTGKDHSPLTLAVHFSLGVCFLTTVSSRRWDRSGFSQYDSPCLLRGLCTLTLCYQVVFPQAGDMYYRPQERATTSKPNQ